MWTQYLPAHWPLCHRGRCADVLATWMYMDKLIRWSFTFEKRKEGNVLFNDALNTFYNLRLYGVTHMVKRHSDSEIGNPQRHMGYSFRLAARVFYMHHSTDRIIHTTAFVTRVVEHWLELEIAQWVHDEGSICLSIARRANALTTELHVAPWDVKVSLVFCRGVEIVRVYTWKCTSITLMGYL